MLTHWFPPVLLFGGCRRCSCCCCECFICRECLLRIRVRRSRRRRGRITLLGRGLNGLSHEIVHDGIRRIGSTQLQGHIRIDGTTGNTAGGTHDIAGAVVLRRSTAVRSLGGGVGRVLSSRVSTSPNKDPYEYSWAMPCHVSPRQTEIYCLGCRSVRMTSTIAIRMLEKIDRTNLTLGSPNKINCPLAYVHSLHPQRRTCSEFRAVPFLCAIRDNVPTTM